MKPSDGERGDPQVRRPSELAAPASAGREAAFKRHLPDVPKTVILFGSYAPSLLNFRGRFIAAMIKRGHKVIAVAPEISPDVSSALRVLGATPREVPIVNTSLDPIGILLAFGQLRTLMREIRPDVVISYTIKPVVVGALAAAAEGVPQIVSFVTGVGYAFTKGRELKRLIARTAAWVLYRLALGRSHKVIFQNPDDLALFRKIQLLRPEHDSYIVASSGVDLNYYYPAEVPEKTAFLMMARLLKDKGIREFAQAAKRLKSEYPDVPVALAGFHHKSPDALTSAGLDDLVACGVDFKGNLSDVRPAVAECSVFVLPSYREGGPQSILEAMSMGRAIITTDVPGCRERVQDGINGFLVPARDADGLYEAMLRFIRDPSLAKSMGKASRRLAEQKYAVERVNADLIEIAGL